VTGASRGIGSAIANALVEQGAHVVLSSRKQADLDEEAARINAHHPERATAIAAHAGRPEDLERLVETVMERFAHIDILVNNAATNPYFGPMLGAELPAWDKTFEVNLRGVFILTKLVYEACMETRGGAIVNVASIRGLRPGHVLGVYNLTKAGVIMLTRQLAREIGGTVRVNAVAPGLIKTRYDGGKYDECEKVCTAFIDLKSDPALAEIPVIIVTIVDNEPMGLDLGAASYLVKPVDRDRLAVLVEKYRMARSGDVERHSTPSVPGAKKSKRQTELKSTGDFYHADDLVGRRQ